MTFSLREGPGKIAGPFPFFKYFSQAQISQHSGKLLFRKIQNSISRPANSQFLPSAIYLLSSPFGGVCVWEKEVGGGGGGGGDRGKSRNAVDREKKSEEGEKEAWERLFIKVHCWERQEGGRVQQGQSRQKKP